MRRVRGVPLAGRKLGLAQAGSRLVAFAGPRPVSATPFWACEVPFSPSLEASDARASEFDVRVLRLFSGSWRAPHQHGTSSAFLEHHRSAQVLFGVVHAVPNHPRLPSSLRERPGRVRSCSSSPLDPTSDGPARGLHAPPGPNGLLRGRHVPPALIDTPTSSSYPACRFLSPPALISSSQSRK